MISTRNQLAGMPLILRFAVVGATAALLLGGLVGLVLGLSANPATAWFAVFEVGIPTSILGALLGTFVGVVTALVQRINRR